MSRHSLGEGDPKTLGAILWRTVPVWAALIALALASCALAYVPMGGFNMAASLAIAAAKMVMVGVFFMHLRRPDPLLRLSGGAWLLWISFLLALVFADQATRAPISQPARTEGVTQRPTGPAGMPSF
ncbi:cytochrome C oxidase subunit IV family protein [Roseomonas sp. E05]|uniref:cytochrome C oxidase subunit IV family protein n=1 Tax=Roseomonas sp. E05 TaxID=3046310 RepID=UPI0024B930CF|nr:cytochrome C oxidase subunit IV family protein [Roseomonas sp. E05]MDJ0387563.1 cytochrome C oxidase subunit IV family protein [Roseomonas sp. E05]